MNYKGHSLGFCFSLIRDKCIFSVFCILEKNTSWVLLLEKAKSHLDKARKNGVGLQNSYEYIRKEIGVRSYMGVKNTFPCQRLSKEKLNW